MTYNEYTSLCLQFRKEIKGVRRKSPFQQRKAVDLMDLAKRMGDHRSSVRVVGCSNHSILRWRRAHA
jgi:hypothetical protein